MMTNLENYLRFNANLRKKSEYKILGIICTLYTYKHCLRWWWDYRCFVLIFLNVIFSIEKCYYKKVRLEKSNKGWVRGFIDLPPWGASATTQIFFFNLFLFRAFGSSRREGLDRCSRAERATRETRTARLLWTIRVSRYLGKKPGTFPHMYLSRAASERTSLQTDLGSALVLPLPRPVTLN